MRFRHARQTVVDGLTDELRRPTDSVVRFSDLSVFSAHFSRRFESAVSYSTGGVCGLKVDFSPIANRFLKQKNEYSAIFFFSTSDPTPLSRLAAGGIELPLRPVACRAPLPSWLTRPCPTSPVPCGQPGQSGGGLRSFRRASPDRFRTLGRKREYGSRCPPDLRWTRRHGVRSNRLKHPVSGSVGT